METRKQRSGGPGLSASTRTFRSSPIPLAARAGREQRRILAFLEAPIGSADGYRSLGGTDDAIPRLLSAGVATGHQYADDGFSGCIGRCAGANSDGFRPIRDQG